MGPHTALVPLRLQARVREPSMLALSVQGSSRLSPCSLSVHSPSVGQRSTVTVMVMTVWPDVFGFDAVTVYAACAEAAVGVPVM